MHYTKLQICFFFIIILTILPDGNHSLPAKLSIGGLFSRDEIEEKIMFYAAVEKIGNNFNQTIFRPHVQLIDTSNAFDANRKGLSFSLLFQFFFQFLIFFRRMFTSR